MKKVIISCLFLSLFFTACGYKDVMDGMGGDADSEPAIWDATLWDESLWRK